MSIYAYESYRLFLKSWILKQPHNGYGQLKKMAEFIGASSVVLSQTFSGSRDLTMEHAEGITRYLGLNDQEVDYFLLLVQYERAGSESLKKTIKRQLAKLKKDAEALKSRIEHHRFKKEDLATFYSQWYYSATRLACSIPDLNSPIEISDALGISRSTASKVIQFLLQHQLVVQNKNRWELGPRITHIGHDSPHVPKHHVNWRLKSLQYIEKIQDKDLFYTGPMVMSEKCAEQLREDLIELIKSNTRRVAQSDSETLRCLNIDWFQIY